MGLLGWLRTLISIHALLAESDKTNRCTTVPNFNFYPRSPCGERHRYGRPIDVQLVFLSTLSLRRATDTSLLMQCQAKFLSTLSLRRATVTVLGIQHKVGISIHALLAESDYILTITISTVWRFLSTLSLRRATNDAINGCNPDFISIHALLAESDLKGLAMRWNTCISIHALLAESDANSRAERQEQHISIHALLAESDTLI